MGLTPHPFNRKLRDAAIFFAAHCALALLLIETGPESRDSIPAPIAWWGHVVETIVPNVSHWSSITRFEAAAWLTLVTMWTLLPLSVWWAARGDWVFDGSTTEPLRRRPSVLLFLAALLIAIVAFVVFQVPELHEPGHWSKSGRRVRSAVSSPLSFGIHAGIVLGAVAMCLGVLPQTFRRYRDLRQSRPR